MARMKQPCGNVPRVGEVLRRNHDQGVFKTLPGVGHMPHHVRAEVCVELLKQLIEGTVSTMDNEGTLVA
ncbi:hypothetical protein RCCGEPOP_25392 [Rhizobium sp. Pop5]|nr:hypothetical protein RCCGEPOP_25392 [Rhizobium sp. Pop5]